MKFTITTVYLGLAALATAQDSSSASSTTAAAATTTNSGSGPRASVSGSVSGNIEFGNINGKFNKTLGEIFDGNDSDSDDDDDKKKSGAVGSNEILLGRGSLGYMVAAGVVVVGAAIL
ncbi:hypothetical protein QBC35DRAFT_456706 [Podospora australis]|uniref:Uncharacterized protein n=1 Tax=Podospora australis TaxID=1536484 RepID=A0AAN6WMH7_9PEZI|nr:hypothetical protein QBC35DRAFT_456706 [Podospora australis]